MEQKVKRVKILTALLEDSYRQENTEWPRRNLRFSDAGAGAKEGSKCERQIYYDIYFAEKKTKLTSTSLVLFDDGKLHEQDIRRRLRTILKSPEREVYDPDTQAKGKIDNEAYKEKFLSLAEEQPCEILETNPGLEIKSANEFTYQEMANSEQLQTSYYDQVQYYLWATQKPFWIVLIKNRNSFGAKKGEIPFLEFIVYPDEARQAEIRVSLKAVKMAIDEKVHPPRPFTKDTTQCQFCRYKYECWPDLYAEEQAAEQKPGKDEAVPEPSQEVLESAMRMAAKLGEEIKEKEEERDKCKTVVTNYFKARGEKEVIVGDVKALYSPVSKTVIDIDYLRNTLNYSQFRAVSSPQVSLLKQAVADRKIDGGIVEKSTEKQTTGWSTQVRRVKEKKAARVATLKTPKKKNAKKKKASRN